MDSVNWWRLADTPEKLKPESLLFPPLPPPRLFSVLIYTTFLLWSVVDDLNMSFDCSVFWFGEVTFIWEML